MTKIGLKYNGDASRKVNGRPVWEATLVAEVEVAKADGGNVFAGVGSTPEEAVGFLVLGNTHLFELEITADFSKPKG